MIKKLLVLGFFMIGIWSCQDDDSNFNRNPFLLETNFSFQLSNIQSLDLQIPSNPVFVSGVGIKGAYVINTGSGLRAWEASDPNHAPNGCSRMVLDGILVSCTCEDLNTYNLFTGQADGAVLEYTMLSYRAENNGGIVTIRN